MMLIFTLFQSIIGLDPLIVLNGSLPEGRLSVVDYESIIKQLNVKFLHQQKIGRSFENRPITAYYLSLEDNIKDKKHVLIDSLHHAREVITVQMNLYLLISIINRIENGDPFFRMFLETTVIWFVPFINIDGYILVEQLFSNNTMPMVRKNRNTKNTAKCSLYDQGVDLNRNYGYQFNTIKSEGSDPCGETYRGQMAFSEYETQAIKNLLNKYEFILALNLHSYGNLFIIPYNYENIQVPKDTLAAKVYEHYDLYGGLPNGVHIGNAFSTIQYLADGEASDWMLHEKDIIVLSPELGIFDSLEDKNFFPDRNKSREILITYTTTLFNFISYAPFRPVLQGNSSIGDKIRYTFQNIGLQGSKNIDIITQGKPLIVFTCSQQEYNNNNQQCLKSNQLNSSDNVIKPWDIFYIDVNSNQQLIFMYKNKTVFQTYGISNGDQNFEETKPNWFIYFLTITIIILFAIIGFILYKFYKSKIKPQIRYDQTSDLELQGDI